MTTSVDALRARLAEITDLTRTAGLLSWDQQTMMPPRGSGARAEEMATLQRVLHERATHPELGRLLDAAGVEVDVADLDDVDAALVRVGRRDHEKAVRVPADLSADLARAAAHGHEAWTRAREADDFGAFLPSLERNLELAGRYAACFPEAATPYDALLDDYEPGATAAELDARFGEIRAGLVPLIAAIAHREPREEGPLRDDYPADAQRAFVWRVISALGADDAAWRLDESVHPFSAGLAQGDIRVTTRCRPGHLGPALFSTIHEFGHGLYEHNVAPELDRTPLADGASLGIHESQSRLWENIIGRSEPFCRWLLPRAAEAFPDALDGVEVAAFHAAANRVAPSLIRVEADEATYPLHIVLRFGLERDLLEGRLAARDLPAAWNAGMADLLGVEVESDRHGVLQDVHWAEGAIGYFPTYLLGSAISAQLWQSLAADVPDVEARIAAGDFAPVRDWLREHVHRHGRKLLPGELLERATGRPLDVAPYLDYLRDKYARLYDLDSDAVAAEA